MMKMFKQARAALSLLSADEVLARAETPVHIGLVADSSGAYAEMEEFLVPHNLPRPDRLRRLGQVYRASDAEPPNRVDIVIYEPGLACPDGAYTYYRGHPEDSVKEILRD
jgi:hypothetical protein